MGLTAKSGTPWISQAPNLHYMMQLLVIIITLFNSQQILPSKVALLFEETTNERGNLQYPAKNLPEPSREPTNSTHVWCQEQNQTQATLVEGKCSNHGDNLAPQMNFIS